MEKEQKTSLGQETIPVVEEELKTGKRKVTTGISRVHMKVHEEEQLIEEPLARQDVVIERVRINRYIERPVQRRNEGDVLIIPVMEEVLVVEKRLLLKEEIHISQRTETVTHRQKETVRKEEAVVEKVDPTTGR